jgi:hypothetical protein
MQLFGTFSHRRKRVNQFSGFLYKDTIPIHEVSTPMSYYLPKEGDNIWSGTQTKQIMQVFNEKVEWFYLLSNFTLVLE